MQTIQYDDRFLSVDEETLKTNLFSIPLESFIAFSQGIPWQLKNAGMKVQKIETDPYMLSIHFASNKIRIKLQFHFTEGGHLIGNIQLACLQDLQDSFFALNIPVPDAARLVMPMSLYNNNPSSAPESNVPRFPAEGKASLLFEESRFPVPGVNAEFGDHFLSLFLIPGQGCSLGAERVSAGDTRLVVGTGCVAFNGEHDYAYESKNESIYHAKGYRNWKKGETFSFDIALNWGKTEYSGQGFRDLIHSGFALLNPLPDPAMDRAGMIRLKSEALSERWCGDGYLHTMPDNVYKAPPYCLFGWSGQSVRLALCDIRYGVLYHDPARIRRGLHAVQFFVEHAESPVPGLFNTLYLLEDRKWYPANVRENYPSRSLGETFSDLVRLMLYCRENGIEYPDSFQNVAERGLKFMLEHTLPEGIPPAAWTVEGKPASDQVAAAGTSMLVGLFAMAKLTGESFWMEQGTQMLERFWKIAGDHFDTPFSHATLDAGCEDKEAAIPFFVAAADAWAQTKNPRFKHMAEASADWLLTWVYLWNVPLRPDSICAHYDFKSVGWPSVSVENQHLDVFFPAWEMADFGIQSGNPFYQRAGELVFKAWSHGISKGGGDWLFSNPGRQAEQFFQTEWSFPLNLFDNYAQPFKYCMQNFGYTQENINKKNHCGGCNPWDVSWIIALVLEAALCFEEHERKE